MSFNLSDVLVALGHSHLNRPALISDSRQFTFAELSASAAQVAHALQSKGITADQNVGLALRDGIDCIVHLFALWMIDAVGVIIDFRSPAAERAALAADFDLVAIITENAHPGAPYRSIALSDPDWGETLATLPTAPPVSSRTGSGVAVISLTSGTTGRPLGLLVHHETTLTRIAQRLHSRSAGPGMHFSTLPMHFSAGRNGVIERLIQGQAVFMYPALFSIEELAQEVIRRRPDSLTVVPTVLRGLLDYAKERPAPLFPSLREFICGGSMTSPQDKRDARRLLSSSYSEAYASSLCSTVSWLTEDEIDAHADTVGRVLPMVRLEIVDDNDNVLPTGEAGLIRVRTPSMVTGTYKDRTRPHGDRIKDGWVYPGDIGSLDAEGFLRILGRASDVIIRGGANVHPSEIESVIAAHPAVKEVAVVGYASEREGEEIAAFVVADGRLGETDLAAFVRTRLAPDKRPRRFVLVDALPQTSVGKPDRKAMRARLESA